MAPSNRQQSVAGVAAGAVESTQRIAIVSAALGCFVSGLLLAGWDVAILRAEAGALMTDDRQRQAPMQEPEDDAAAEIAYPVWQPESSQRIHSLSSRLRRLHLEAETLKAQAASLDEGRQVELEATADRLWHEAENAAGDVTHPSALATHYAASSESIMRQNRALKERQQETAARLQSLLDEIRRVESEYERSIAAARAEETIRRASDSAVTTVPHASQQTVHDGFRPAGISLSPADTLAELALAHVERLTLNATSAAHFDWMGLYTYQPADLLDWQRALAPTTEYAAADDSDGNWDSASPDHR